MSTNRYSALNRRAGPSAASSLFADYPSSSSQSRPSSATSHARPSYAYPSSSSPRPSSPYTAGGGVSPNPLHSSYSPHPASTSTPTTTSSSSLLPTHYHTATPNSKGQYSASVLESLESQNETEQTNILSAKVGQLKQLTQLIGDEIRDSSSLAGTINEQFEDAGLRLKGTMRRMLRMADRTGVGWKVWLLFFAAVWALFVWVWLF